MSGLEMLVLVYLGGYLLLYVLGELSARHGLGHARSLRPTDRPEPVSVIKPVYGLDEFSEEAFRSWLTQEYDAEVQVVFSLQDPADPALALLERLAHDPGLRGFEVIVNPIEPGYHGKSSNLLHGVRRARHDRLVFADADIVAPPDTLSKLVGALQGGAGAAGTLIVHTRARGVWARIYAFAWNVATLQSLGFLLARGRGPCLPGGTVALTREALETIGGVEGFGRYVAEDLAMSVLIVGHGIRRAMGAVVESPVARMSLADWLQKLSRLRIYRQLPLWPFNLVGILVQLGGYLPLTALAVALRSPFLVGACGAFLLGRAWLWARFTGLYDGRARWGLDFLVMDVTILLAGLGAFSSRHVRWAGVGYRIDARGAVTA